MPKMKFRTVRFGVNLQKLLKSDAHKLGDSISESSHSSAFSCFEDLSDVTFTGKKILNVLSLTKKEHVIVYSDGTIQKDGGKKRRRNEGV